MQPPVDSLASLATPAAKAADVTAAPTPAPLAGKPEWLPDDLWDAEKGFKADLVKQNAEMAKAAAERKALVPEKADGYKLELPAGFKAPEGMTLNEADPRLPLLREHALKAGWTQTDFAQVIALDVARAQADQARIAAQIALESAKLGPNAPERIDKVLKHIDGSAKSAEVARHLKSMLVTADIVEHFETLAQKSASGGADPLRSNGREATNNSNEIEGYAKMSFEQIRMAQIARAQQSAR